MTKIQCPKCGVKYTVEKPQEKVIKCMDCGADYFQAVHKENVYDFVRQASLRTRGK